ncbi:MAG: amidase family protein [Alphaproteobacteria bacterium]
MSDPSRLDATAQAELIRRGEIRPHELLDAAIARIERVNPRLNAVVTTLYDQARAASTARGQAGGGPFAGVPFLLKDLLARLAGARQTAGSAALADAIDDHDSELVLRMKRAGLVILGKTNTPEFGLLPTTEPQLFGPTRNPWDPARSAGGSSGGSAAAVAARLVPMAHANDGGGSIRIPASCCGVFGLKPTRGRNPLGPDVGDIMGGLVVEHAVSLSVRDSAALLDATAGPDAGAPYWAEPPARPFAAEIGADPGQLRIGFSTTAPAGTPIHPDCVAAVEDAARLCESLGHAVHEAAPIFDGPSMYEAFMTLWAASTAGMIESLERTIGPGARRVEPATAALAARGRTIPAVAYMGAIARLQAIARAIARFFETHDLWLTPTLGHPPPPLGHFDTRTDNLEALFDRSREFVPFTLIANFTGQPAMSVPLYWNAHGLPIGVHVMGRYGDEATLFRLASQLETARPWATRVPPIAA